MSEVLHTVFIKVTREWLEDCCSSLGVFCGISFTPEQALEIFKENKSLLIASINYGFETGEREQFQGAFAKKMLGIDWPTYGESHEPQYENFHERIMDAARKAGYEVQDES